MSQLGKKKKNKASLKENKLHKNSDCSGSWFLLRPLTLTEVAAEHQSCGGIREKLWETGVVGWDLDYLWLEWNFWGHNMLMMGLCGRSSM